MYPELKPYVVLITGGASGLGLAAAHGFAKEGATIVIADLQEAAAVGVAFALTPLPKAHLVGMPLRREIEILIDSIAGSPDLPAAKANARKFFGLSPDSTTLLVTGGSLGAKRINETIEESRKVLSAAGIQVLHIVGGRSDLEAVNTPDYVRISYCDRMDLAILASDFAVSRAGSSTVSEFTAVGLPAAYVPYPIGNGEQRLNAMDLVEAGRAKIVQQSDFDAHYVQENIKRLLDQSEKTHIEGDPTELLAAEKIVNLIEYVSQGSR